MDVEVITCSGIYGDGVKAGATVGVPIDEPLQMDFNVPLM